MSSVILAIPTLKGCREYWCDWGWSLKQKCVKCWLLHCTAPWLPSWLRANLRSQVHTKHTKYGRVQSSQIVLEQQIIGQLCLTTEGMAHLICFRKSQDWSRLDMRPHSSLFWTFYQPLKNSLASKNRGLGVVKKSSCSRLFLRRI